MSKIVIRKKHGKVNITNRLTYPETVNERLINAIAYGMFEGFLPVSVKQKRKETRIECSVQGLLTLNEYFQGTVSKKMFLDFAYQLALLIKNCDKNMVNSNNLDLQKDRVFVDPLTKSVKCIFWPVVNNQRSEPAHLFLKQLPYDVNFSPHEDNAYLEQYAAFFDGYNPFSINSFERLILNLQEKNAGGEPRTPSSVSSGALTERKRLNELPKNKNNIEYNPFASTPVATAKSQIHDGPGGEEHVFCPGCGAENHSGNNFCSVCGRKLIKHNSTESVAAPKIDFGTMVLGDNTAGTAVLGYDDPKKSVYPYLFRHMTDEKIMIDKPVFRIGADRTLCDLFIVDNGFISRNHADIITKNGRYFVVDKNSTNKTYVDGTEIPGNIETEIFSGTQIRLANEEFTFDLE